MGWRVRFNQLRSRRHRYGPGKELVPLGGDRVNTQTVAEARLEYSFLSAVPSLVLESTQQIGDKEWFAAVKRRKTLKAKGQKPGRMPRFRRRQSSPKSFVCWYNGGRGATFERTGKKSGVVTISGQNPAKFRQEGAGARFKIRLHVRLSQPIRPYTSVQVNWGKRELVFVNPPQPLRVAKARTAVGLDRGVAHNLADSHGNFYDLPKDRLRAIDKKVCRLQKAQARAVKASGYKHTGHYLKAGASNRYQAKTEQIAKLKAKAARIVLDHQQKWTTELIVGHDLIGLEDLSVKNMTRRAKKKPDPIRPGKYLPNRAKAKSGLNRVLQQAALGRVQALLEYKAKNTGTKIVLVDPKNTSRTCRPCGHIDKNNRESQAVFLCQKCGHQANADTNAALNIEDAAVNQKRGRTVPGVETQIRPGVGTEPTLARSVKRKPPKHAQAA